MKYIVAAWAIIVITGFIFGRLRPRKEIKLSMEERFLMRDKSTKYPFTANSAEVEQLMEAGDTTYHGRFGGGFWYNNQWIPEGYDIVDSVRPTSKPRGGTDSGGGEG